MACETTAYRGRLSKAVTRLWARFHKGRTVPQSLGTGFSLPRARRCFLCLCLIVALTFILVQQAVLICYCGHWLFQASATTVNTNTARYIHYFPERQWREGLKTVLIWDHKFPFSQAEANFAECPVSNCRLTTDKSELEHSDAVLFSSRGLWNKFRGYPMPTYRAPHQVSQASADKRVPPGTQVYAAALAGHMPGESCSIHNWVWVMSTMENPPETWLDWSKYTGVFNWTLHYRRDADLVGVYGDVIPRDKLGVPAGKMETEKEARQRNYAREKRKMVAWMASNCVDDARRQRVVQELSRYIRVDTYGACGELPQASNCKQGSANCEGPVLAPYRFYLALENARCRDYATEKFFNAMVRAQIPITDNDMHSIGRAPRGSYIQISDFNSMKDLADHLKMLAKNETAYNQHLLWRRTHKVQYYTAPWCQLCEQLHNKSRPAQVYTDLYGWLQNDTCQPLSPCNYLKRVLEGWALYYHLIS